MRKVTPAEIEQSISALQNTQYAVPAGAHRRAIKRATTILSKLLLQLRAAGKETKPCK